MKFFTLVSLNVIREISYIQKEIINLLTPWETKGWIRIWPPFGEKTGKELHTQKKFFSNIAVWSNYPSPTPLTRRYTAICPYSFCNTKIVYAYAKFVVLGSPMLCQFNIWHRKCYSLFVDWLPIIIASTAFHTILFITWVKRDGCMPFLRTLVWSAQPEFKLHSPIPFSVSITIIPNIPYLTL